MNKKKAIGIVLIILSLISLISSIFWLVVVTQNERTLAEEEYVEDASLGLVEFDKTSLEQDIQTQWILVGFCSISFLILLIFGIALCMSKEKIEPSKPQQIIIHQSSQPPFHYTSQLPTPEISSSLNKNTTLINMENSSSLKVKEDFEKPTKFFRSKLCKPGNLFKCKDNSTPSKEKDWIKNGLFFAREEKYEEAIKSFDKALEINPHYSKAWNNKGIVLAKLKKYNDAIKCYDNALNIEPSNEYAIKNKLIALDKLNQENDQKSESQEILQKQSNSEKISTHTSQTNEEVTPIKKEQISSVISSPSNEILNNEIEKNGISNKELLNLLELRLIKGEITEKTYNELKKKYE